MRNQLIQDVVQIDRRLEDAPTLDAVAELIMRGFSPGPVTTVRFHGELAEWPFSALGWLADFTVLAAGECGARSPVVMTVHNLTGDGLSRRH